MAGGRTLWAAVNSPWTDRDDRPLAKVLAESAEAARRGPGRRNPAGNSKHGPTASPPSSSWSSLCFAGGLDLDDAGGDAGEPGERESDGGEPGKGAGRGPVGSGEG